MYKIPNITSDPNQILSPVLPDGVNTVQLTMKYISNLKAWYMDLVYLDRTIKGIRICNCANLLRQLQRIIPFGIGCVVNDGTDPFFIDDFEKERASLLLLTQDEIDAYEAYLTSQKIP